MSRISGRVLESLGLVGCGLLLAAVAYTGYAAGARVVAQAATGATAYGWLASPAADGSPDVRAKILEDLIAREVAAQKARP